MTFRAVIFCLFAIVPALAGAEDLTLEQIMADPDWLGNQPEDAYWGPDNRSVYFELKRQGSELRDLYAVDSSDGAIAQVAERDWSQVSRSSVVYSEAGDLHAWTYAGDVFLSDGDEVRQVTRTAVTESAPMFMNDGRVAFERGGQLFLFDRDSGFAEQVTNIRFEDDPNDDEDFEVLRHHHERLYSQSRKDKKDEEEARQRDASLYELDEALSAAPIYFGDKVESRGFALSPDGRRLLVVTAAADSNNGKTGSMRS